MEQQQQTGPQLAAARQIRSRRHRQLEPRLPVKRVDYVHPVEPVGQSGCVREQVPDPHWFDQRLRHRLQREATAQDPAVGEGGDEPADRVLELERAVTTTTGLTVRAALDTDTYSKGIRIPDQEMGHYVVT